MGEETIAKISDGWLVCGECGRKLAQIDGKNIKIICRGSRYVGNHVVILENGGGSDDCSIDCDCNDSGTN